MLSMAVFQIMLLLNDAERRASFALKTRSGTSTWRWPGGGRCRACNVCSTIVSCKVLTGRAAVTNNSGMRPHERTRTVRGDHHRFIPTNVQGGGELFERTLSPSVAASKQDKQASKGRKGLPWKIIATAADTEGACELAIILQAI